jgi:hypothetical protein
MHKSSKKQAGLGFLSIILLILVVSFFGTLFFKMAPCYFKYWQVRSAMEAVQGKPDVIEQGMRKITQSVLDQLYIDEVRSVTAENFTIKKSATSDGFDLTVDYKEQVPIVFNVEALMTFTYTVVLNKP